MFLAWCVVFHHVLSVTSLQTLEPEGSRIEDGWDDALEDDANETYYQGELQDLQRARMRSDGDQCQGCVFTADLRCQHKMATRGGYYHRLADCLVPAYGLIHRARQFLPVGKVCILSKTGILFPALGSIVGIEHFELIEETAACAKNLTLTAVDARSVKGAEKGYVKSFPRQTENIVPIYLPDNMALLHDDVVKLATPAPDPVLILVIREGQTRHFTYNTKLGLRRAISGVAGSPEAGWPRLGYTEYHGRESLKRVLDIFVNAAGVVGYHGAGLVNTLFTRRPSCVMEISPLTRSGNPWRSNDELAHLSSNLVWEKFHLKYGDMRRANPLEGAVGRHMWQDDFYKWLPHVDISDSDVADLRQRFVACLASHVFSPPK